MKEKNRRKTQNEMHFGKREAEKNDHEEPNERKYWSFNRILKSYMQTEWMMHSKDLQEEKKTSMKYGMHEAPAHNFDLQCRYTNNEGSNANEHLLYMQFKSISSCITFHTFSRISYSACICGHSQIELSARQIQQIYRISTHFY